MYLCDAKRISVSNRFCLDMVPQRLIQPYKTAFATQLVNSTVPCVDKIQTRYAHILQAHVNFLELGPLGMN
jgi:hypothetical protein